MKQLDFLCKKYKITDSSCIPELVIKLLDDNKQDEAIYIINGFILDNVFGKEVLIVTALEYDSIVLFKILNSYWDLDINGDLITKLLKYNCDTILDELAKNHSKYNINFGENNYICLQMSIQNLDDSKFLPAFTSVMRLFGNRMNMLEHNKVINVFNCLLRTAMYNHKWFFLSIIASMYSEYCNMTADKNSYTDGYKKVSEDLTRCFRDDYLSYLSYEESKEIVDKIKEIYVLKRLLDL